VTIKETEEPLLTMWN